ncbi:hypothetical protein RD1_1854 [Roseobacter denitrificans OCh 114]|uniref:Uncharacterized protein n=1 Tax=Roseobacter denitrificans (strain ATCC 33942 / OCh 114) TaxID=375451 RepID=Q168X8_ROSDO|nr:hypothetical protein RD1_1854 [Roseobacter denitrificans OCh 114]
MSNWISGGAKVDAASDLTLSLRSVVQNGGFDV